MEDYEVIDEAQIERLFEYAKKQTGYYDTYMADKNEIEQTKERRLAEEKTKTFELRSAEFIPTEPIRASTIDDMIDPVEQAKNEYREALTEKRYQVEKAVEDYYNGELEQNDLKLVSRIPLGKMDEFKDLAINNCERLDKRSKYWEEERAAIENAISEYNTEHPLNELSEYNPDLKKYYAQLRIIDGILNEVNKELDGALNQAGSILWFQELREQANETAREEDMNYVAEMAQIVCSEGLRRSYLLMPNPHHVYIKGKPLCTETDILSNINIINFGGCTSAKNLGMKERAKKIINDFQEKHGRTPKDSEEADTIELMEMCACTCSPVILGTWKECQDGVTVDGGAPILRRSEIRCKYGGKITFRTSGQED